MKILPQSARLLWITPDSEKMIEQAGRVAYASEEKITEDSAPKFIHMLLKLGHESVIEHACASIEIVCDRGITHEFVRHRLFSYTQESTRYCNFSDDKFGHEINVIQPPGLSEGFDPWYEACRSSELYYFNMLKRGCTPQIARSILPTCLATKLVATCNFREWRHFLRLRLSPKAHPQMQDVSKMILNLLHPHAPTCFEEFTNAKEKD